MMRISGYMITTFLINKWLALSISNNLSLPIFIDLRSSLICDMISYRKPGIVLTWLIIDTTSIALASLLIFFNSSIINLSVYPNKLQANIIVCCSLCLKWSIVRGEFSYVNFIFFFWYQSSYQNDCFFYLQQRPVVPKDFCF
jgi:hypothetical protein